MMEYYVIFDMDGVLVDSHRMIWESFNKILGRYGINLSEEDIKKYKGKSLKDDIVDWNQRYGLKLDLGSFTDEAWDLEVQFLKTMKPDKGLITLLDDLKSNGVHLAVGTSSQRFRADIILKYMGLTEYFPIIISSDDVTLHKPNPDIFLEAARRLKADPTNCVVIEDAQNGICAAKSGGMKVVGYFNGHNDIEDLKESDLVIRNFSDLSYRRIAKLF